MAAKAEAGAPRFSSRRCLKAAAPGADLQFRATVFQSPDALGAEQDQAFAVQVKVHEGKVRAQPVVVLCYPLASSLAEAEYAFKYPEHTSTFALTRDSVVFYRFASWST